MYNRLVFLCLFMAIFGCKTQIFSMELVYNLQNKENVSIELPLRGEVNVLVDWGDGSDIDTITNPGNVGHSFSKVALDTIKITGKLEQFGNGKEYYFGNEYLIEVLSFGNLGLQSLSGAFSGAKNLVQVPKSLPTTVNDLSHMFHEASSFNSDLSLWDVSNITNMDGIFYYTDSFTSDLSSWDVSNVTNMAGMFYKATSFNSDLSSWDVSSVGNMSGMFAGASSFNSDLSSWNVSRVQDMSYMFYYATVFNGNIGSWNVGRVLNMSSMFRGADSFNSDISSWDVKKVVNMFCMFRNAYSFNRDLSSWNVSRVVDMKYMFYNATSFTSDLSLWDVSKVKDMYAMFCYATSFNSDLSLWNVGNVTNMAWMFTGASSFDSDLSSWNVSKVTDMEKMLANTSLSTKNYDKLLYGWSHLSVLQLGIEFGVQGTKYSTFGKKYKNLIMQNKGWVIRDAGMETSNQAPLIVDINPLNKDSIGIKINESLPIKITAFDPEKKPLSYQWKVNDSLLDTTSDSLLFKQTSAGIYYLKVVVIDNKNLKDSISWKIRVSSSGESIVDNIVKESTLFQNYPNPFNPMTNIKFYLTSRGSVSLKVYNYRGEMVRELTNNILNKGFHSFNFDGSLFSSGVYFYRLSGQGFTHQKKMILLK